MAEGEVADEIQIIERYLLLLVGAVQKPVPSREHVQKELFVLSKANPKIAQIITFEKHYEGPYSGDLGDLVNNPVYYVGAFQHDREGRVSITPEGKKLYDDLVQRFSSEPKFRELLAMMKLTRELYDKLSKDELLFLMYATYPEYKEMSKISEELLAEPRRKELAGKLLSKGLITKERFHELVSQNN